MMAAAEFPEPIIQRVQYFLTSKEAARTSVLSKSWGSAWLTRPNLDFDFMAGSGRDQFLNITDTTRDQFLNITDKTLKRYEVSNLKIESFRLCSQYQYLSCDDPNQFRNLIVRALKLGATRLEIITDDFVIPNEVFASENLVELTVENFWIDLEPSQDVLFSRLRSLSLKNRPFESYDDDFPLSRIISRCPLIEKLSLCYISGFSGGVVLPRLRSLELDWVESDTVLLSSLSSNFPSLKDLTLQKYPPYEEGREDMLISSPSLERLYLKAVENHTWKFKLDVPSIRKFTFSGSSIPSLSFRSTSSAWESHVLITRRKSLTTSWFRRLSKLLTKLRRSRIHMSLEIYSGRCFHYNVGDFRGLSTPVMIENLTIDLSYQSSLSCFALLDGLFLMCRPKYITPPQSEIDFIGHTLLQGLEVKPSSPKRFMYGLKDLEEARAQFFDAEVSSWRDVPLDVFLDESRSPAKGIQEVRFKLKWQL